MVQPIRYPTANNQRAAILPPTSKRVPTYRPPTAPKPVSNPVDNYKVNLPTAPAGTPPITQLKPYEPAIQPQDAPKVEYWNSLPTQEDVAPSLQTKAPNTSMYTSLTPTETPVENIQAPPPVQEQYGTIPQPPEAETPGPDMGLYERPMVTEGGRKVSEDIFGQYNRGEFSDVENRRQQLDAEGDQFEYYVMKQARDTAAQQGFQPGTASYQNLMREAMSQANQNRLGIEKGVNEMQRGYRQDATGNLMDIEQAQRELAIGERGWEFTRDDIEYAREKADTLQDDQDVNALINQIQDPKFKNALAAEMATNGVEGVKALIQMGMEGGTIREGFRSQDPNQNRDEQVAKEVENMVLNPFTGKKIESQQEREQVKQQLLDAMNLNQWGLTVEGAEQIGKGYEAKGELTDILAKLDAGETTPNELSPRHWENMSEADIEKYTQPFDKNMKFLRASDFEESQWEADVVSTTHDSGDPRIQDSSAGEGKGSIVLFEGVPYRITRYNTNETTRFGKKDKRTGKVWGVPLKGEGVGKEVELSATES